jgi:hypothetical protein
LEKGFKLHQQHGIQPSNNFKEEVPIQFK